MSSSKSTNRSVEKKEVPFPQDIFRPVLLNSPSLHVTPEQNFYIKSVLDVCCSDSAFAKKAYVALAFILSQEEEVIPVTPTIESINPTTAVIDALGHGIQVNGTGFTVESVITVDGVPIFTGFVSDVRISCTLDGASAVAGVLAIAVDNLGLVSNSVDFTWTDPIVQTASTEKSDAYKAEVKEFEAKKDKK